MARNRKPISQEVVPAQVRFPHEDTINMDIMSTSRPLTNASSGFPGEFPKPTVRPIYAMRGEFIYESHTDGKKKKE